VAGKRKDNFVQQRVFLFKTCLNVLSVRGHSRCDGFTVTNLHHYHVGIFFIVVDKICAVMHPRFSEATMELLLCFSCRDPNNSFSIFDVNKLARVAEIL
jgi:hypothetical protein